MKLRNRKTIRACSLTSKNSRPSRATKSTQLISYYESPLETKVEKLLVVDSPHSDDDVPQARRPLPRGLAHGRAPKRVGFTIDDGDTDLAFKTPTKRQRVLAEIRACSLTPKDSQPSRAMTRTQLISYSESPLQTKVEELLVVDSPPSDDDVPQARRPLPRGLARARARKRVGFTADDGDTDLAFKTPTKPTKRQRVLTEMDVASPLNSTARNIYTPLVRFLTPSKENVKSSGRKDVLMSPEQCVFGFSSMDLLGLGADDDHDDVFSPFSFIKNIPSLSQQAKPSPRDIPPKTRSTPEATLVLDLDETLMYSSLNVIEEAEYTFHTTFQQHQYKVYMVLRPYVKEFLQSMAKIYEMFVYTTAKKQYAEKILDIMDPQRKLFRHRLYQEDCSCVLGHYVKDLGILGRDPAKTVVLDNAPHTYPYNLMNTIPIKSWSGAQEDRELQRLIPYLEKLSTAEDFREPLKRRKDHFHRLLSED